MTPDRKCNGGQTFIWCGKQATRICSAPDGLEWFACDDQHHGAGGMPIDEWFAALRKRFARQLKEPRK